MNASQVYHEFNKIDVGERISLIRQMFLENSFEITEIVKLKEEVLKRKLQREYEMLINADSRLAIILSLEGKNRKSDKKMMEYQKKEAMTHLTYSGKAIIGKFDTVSKEDLDEYESKISFDKNLSPTSYSSSCHAHLH